MAPVNMLDQIVADQKPNESMLDEILADQAPAPEAEPSSFARRALGDTAVSLLKGGVNMEEGVIGAADLVSGGHAGKALKEAGFDTEDTQKKLDALYSPEQQKANEAVHSAEGFVPTLKAIVQNPSVIPNTIAQSLPSTVAGLGIAKGAYALAPKIGELAAGAFGEGAITAGQNAEQTRQQTDDGLLTGKQALINAGSGALTGLITGGSGVGAKALGVGDINTLGFGGKQSTKDLTRNVLEGGGLEAGQELAQSAQEQAASNLALEKPIGEGVGNAAALGAVTGFGMNLPAALSASQRDRKPEDALDLDADKVIGSPLDLGGKTLADLPKIDEDTAFRLKNFTDSWNKRIDSGKPPPNYTPAFVNALGAAGIQHDPSRPPTEAFAELNDKVNPKTPEQKVDAVTADLQTTLDNAPVKGVTGRAAKVAVDTNQTAPQKQAAQDEAEFQQSQDVPNASAWEKFTPTKAEGNLEPTQEDINVFAKGIINGDLDLSDPHTVQFAGNYGTQIRAAVDAQTKPTGVDDTNLLLGIGRKPFASQEDADRVIASFEKPSGGKSETGGVSQDTHAVVPIDGGFGIAHKDDITNGRYQDAKQIDQASGQGGVSGNAEEERPIDDAIAREHPLHSANDYQEAERPEDNKKAMANFQELPIAIENPAGTIRKFKNGQTEMQDHYGEIKAGEGADGDAVDVFIPAGLTRAQIDASDKAYVIDQINPDTGEFDEHKTVLGANSKAEAEAIYKRNYSSDWKGFSAITEMPISRFKEWLKTGDTKAPVARKNDFTTPSEQRTNERRQIVRDEGITNEGAIKRIVPDEDLDAVTGFHLAHDKQTALEQAIEHTRQTGEAAHFVEGDIGNLGGLNAHFGDNHEIVNPIFRQITDIFAEEMRSAGRTAVLIRHGGDEISAVIVGSTDAKIAEALRRAKERTQERVKALGLDAIPHSKAGKKAGVGLYLGESAILPEMTPADVFGIASSLLNSEKTGAKHVRRGETSTVRNITPSGRPSETDSALPPDTQPVLQDEGRVLRGTGTEETGSEQARRYLISIVPDGNLSALRGKQNDVARSRLIQQVLGLTKPPALSKATNAALKDAFYGAVGVSGNSEAAKASAFKQWATTGLLPTAVESHRANQKVVPINRNVVQDSDDLLAAIAKEGGLKRSSAKANGIDKAAFKLRGTNIGLVFNEGSRSKTFDEMAEVLRGHGFDVSGENALLAQVSRAVNQGEKIYNAVGSELHATPEGDDQFESDKHFLLQDAAFDPEYQAQLKTLLDNGGITALNIDEYRAELDGELEAFNLQQKELAEKEAVASARKEKAAKSVDELPDDMFGVSGRTEDIFGGNPMLNPNRVLSLPEIFDLLDKSPERAKVELEGNPNRELIYLVQKHWHDIIFDKGYEDGEANTENKPIKYSSGCN